MGAVAVAVVVVVVGMVEEEEGAAVPLAFTTGAVDANVADVVALEMT